MANIVTVEKLCQYIENGRNVILIGRHGTGKSTMVRAAFEKMKLRYRIFSAATMDPWVDFVGVPRAVPNGKGAMTRGCQHDIPENPTLNLCLTCGMPLWMPVNDEMVLKLARPPEWAHDEVEAILMDEYNRAHKKVRNAVMELVQFKSINDRKFENLRVVWAAVNPDDDDVHEYDVEVIDPAQLDRFHIQIELPYKCNRKFFQDKYGNEVSSTAINWWNNLPDEAKNAVSPRRLEYALDEWQMGGHLEDVLPPKSNISKLRNALKTTPVMSKLSDLFVAQKDETDKAKLNKINKESREFLEDENDFAMVVKEIITKPKMVAYFVPLMPAEKISDLISSEQMVRNFFLRNYAQYPHVREIMEQIVETNSNVQISREIERVFKRAKLDKIRNLGNKTKLNPNRVDSYSACKTNNKFASTLQAVQASSIDDTYARNAAFKKVEDSVPETMSMADAITCLKVLDVLIKRSHGNTVEKWLNMIGVINNCIENLMKANWDFSQFSTKFPKLAGYVVHSNKFYFEVV